MLRVHEVADRINSSISGVYRLIDSGELPVTPIGPSGKSYRVSEEDLTAWLNSRKRHKGRSVQPSPKCNPRAESLLRRWAKG
jgi:excisionase family DNA binding protein